MLQDNIEKFIKIYRENNGGTSSDSNNILSVMYIYYQYYNADETLIDTLEESIADYAYIDGIHESDFDYGNGFDLVKTLPIDNIVDLTIEKINEHLIFTDGFFAKLYSGHKSNELNSVRKLFLEMSIDEDKTLHYILLSSLNPTPELKAEIKDYVSNYQSKLANINYIIFFSDDIEEFINDIDTPSLNVKYAVFKLIDEDQFLFHGREKSLVTSISAKSLKDIYIKYGTNGLFSNNLRYYVKSAKIDSKIKNSIINEPDKFWYLNNGLIITCENYKIKKDNLELYDFSIVNGGQTTNLIGNTVFNEDFPILCKIIKNKYDDKDENLEFLSKVAEASNTQKPIKMKDIIANRIEQTKLKKQLNDVGVFVQIKRGEKISKTLYPEKWQNASNDEIGQMLFSMIYQHPGIARNSKSKMLENDNYYNIIYKNKYNTLLLLSLQHMKVGYHKWALKTKRTSNDQNKIGLSRNGYFLFLAIFGFVLKIYYNNDFYEKIQEYNSSHDFTTDSDFKKAISQNDIGEISIFKSSNLISENNIAIIFYDFLYENFVLPVYKHFKGIYPGSAYSNFTKNDTYYYRIVIPKLISIIQKFWDQGVSYKTFFDEYLVSTEVYKIKLLSNGDIFEEHKPGLSTELVEYRREKYRSYQGKVKAYEIFTNNQKAKISFFKPRNIKSLRDDCGLTDYSVKNFGEDIIKIVEKYVIV